MKKLNKKGILGLNQLTGIIMMLVVIGVMLIVGLVVQDEMQESSFTDTTTTTLTNSTTNANVTEAASTSYPSGINNIGGVRNCVLTVTRVTPFNTSSSANIIHSGNYTITGCYLTFSSTSSDDADRYNQTGWNVTGSSSYGTDSQGWNATGEAKDGLANVSEQQGLLGTIIIFGIIISIVVVAFMVRG